MKRPFFGSRLVLAATVSVLSGVLVSCFSSSPRAGAGGSGGSGASATGAGNGDAGAPVCNGTDSAGNDGGTALWAHSISGATGMGAALRSDGTVVLAGPFSGTTTVFGTALPFTDAGSNYDDVFAAEYLDGKLVTNPPPTAFLGPAVVGQVDEYGDVNTAFQLAVDGQGNTAIAGNFLGTITFGATTLTAQAGADDAGVPYQLDGFVALFDASFNPLWAKRLGSELNDSADGLAFDSKGNVVVLLVSGSNGDEAVVVDDACGGIVPVSVPSGSNAVSVVELDPTGACVWHQRFQVQNQFDSAYYNGVGLAIAVDPSDDVILGGGCTPATSSIGAGPLGSNPYNTHPFLARLSTAAKGAVTMTQVFESSGSNKVDGNQGFTALATDPCGNIVAGGYFSGGVTFGSLPTLVDAYTSAQDLDQQAFVVEFDPQFKGLWQQSITGYGQSGVSVIRVNHASDIAVGGVLLDSVDSNGIAFAGTRLPPPLPLSPYQADFYLAKLKGDGSLRWATRYGGLGNDHVYGLALDDDGHLAATGDFEATTITFGPGVSVTSSATSMYAVELGP